MSEHLKTKRAIAAAAVTALSLSACSTRPRNFAAQVSTPVADRVAFENDYRTCDALVRSGHESGFRTAATGAAVGAGAGAAGVGAFAASTGGAASGWGGVGAGLGAAAAAATLAVGVVGFGVTRMIRGGKERKFKRNMSACLGEYGYEVAEWDKLKKKDDSAAFAARSVTVSQPSIAAEPSEPAIEPAVEVRNIPAGDAPTEVTLVSVVD